MRPPGSLSLSNTAEVSTTNIRSGAAFDNVKASWNQVRMRAAPQPTRSAPPHTFRH